MRDFSNSRSRREKAILVGIGLSDPEESGPRFSPEENLEELERLAQTGGAEVVGRFSQHLKSIHPATFIGWGKVEEIRRCLQDNEANLVVVDEDLSPAQQRNLETALQVRVIDRSKLILDIFAQRARTKEGKLQVELAQLEYLLPRLTRRWLHLSRLGGGIGTRGPGETQLEVDRRRLRERIGTLKRRLKTVEQTRSLQRGKRSKVPYATVALVGYTNSGKSTLMNALTRAGVVVEDKLFATLDPTLRCLRLPHGEKVMLADTVGFINKIPHSLIEAFKSTLEEVRTADLLLHLVDMTCPLYDEQIRVVQRVLGEIGAGSTPSILVPNKIDVAPPGSLRVFGQRGQSPVCPVSALKGVGFEGLLGTIESIMDRGKEIAHFHIASSEGSVLSILRSQGRILDEKYDNGTMEITALLTPKLAGQLRRWMREKGSETVH